MERSIVCHSTLFFFLSFSIALFYRCTTNTNCNIPFEKCLVRNFITLVCTSNFTTLIRILRTSLLFSLFQSQILISVTLSETNSLR